AFVLATTASWGVVLLGNSWKTAADDSLQRRIVQGSLGVLLGLAAVWLEGYSLGSVEPALDPWQRKADTTQRSPFFGALYANNTTISVAVGHMAYFGLMFAAIRWWRLVEPIRPSRIEWADVIAICFLAFVLLFLLPSAEERLVGFATVAMTAIAVQAVSPRR